MLDVAGAAHALLDGRDAGSRRDENVDVERGAEHRQAQFSQMARAYLQLTGVRTLQARTSVNVELRKPKLTASSGEGLRKILIRAAPMAGTVFMLQGPRQFSRPNRGEIRRQHACRSQN